VTVTGSTDPDNPTYYDVSSIDLSGNGQVLSITGHVVFVMSGDIDVTGKGGIVIDADSSFQIYTEDDVKIAGNGVANVDMVPGNFKIYGTAQTSKDASGEVVAGQTIDISGNGQLGAVVYAPAAEVSLNGGGTSGAIMGALVAFYAEIKGGSSFHFDEATREVIEPGGIYTIESWLEMTGATLASTPLDLSQY
jgi:hypothetical protein